MSETSHSPLPEPENAEADAYLRKQLDSYELHASEISGFEASSAE
jgi:hypothetical protein